MTIEVQFTAKCSVCGREFVKKHGVCYGAQMINPHFDEFRQFDDMWVCAAHQVTLTISREGQEPLVILR